MGPGVNTPNAENLTDPRRYEYQVGWNMPIGVPGSEGLKLASFANLRAISDLYSVAAACINVRITEIRGLEWDIVPTKDAEKGMRQSPGQIAEFQKRRAELIRFFKRPDSDYADFSSWITAALYDLFQVDALSIYLHPTRMKGKGLLGSNLAELALIDGTSIRPLVDVYGARPKPPNVAYQQYLYGVPRTDLMTPPDPELIEELQDSELVAEYGSNQLLYLPYTTRRWTPYGFAPIERAMIPAMAGLNRQQFQLDFFNEGSIPGVFVSPGDTAMTFDQMRTLQDALNALAGDPAWKHKIIVLPPGTNVQPQKPIDLATQFDEIIMNQMCMAYDVMPMELGITPKVSVVQSPSASNQMAKASADINQRKALKPLLSFLKSTIFDKVIQEICGQADMEWYWEGTEQGTDEQAEVGILTDKISIGLMSIDEGRGELGLQPWGLPITSDPGMVTQNGFIPLGAIDPTTGTPIGNQPQNFGDETAPAPGDSGGAPGGNPNKPAAKPTADDVARPAQTSGGTPGHSGAGTATAEADRQVGSKPGQSAKAALAELDSLRRRLKQGRSIEDWTPKSISQGVLDSMLYSLRMGEDPIEVVGKARQAVTEAHEQRSRRDAELDGIKRDVASGLGKLANGLRTGRIAAPTFTSHGLKVMEAGFGRAMRAGAAHAMEDRKHPHALKSVASHAPDAISGSYHELSQKLGKFWDTEAESRAEDQRKFLERLANYVLGMPAKKDDSEDGLISEIATIGARLDLYGSQTMSAYENAYGVTGVAASQVEAEVNGDDGATTDEGDQLAPGEQIITWHTTDTECELCADRDNEQYTIETLPGWPGDGFFGDLCAGGPNCNCYLTYDDATEVNNIKVNGYAADRAQQAAEQQDRLDQLNQVRQIFVDSLPDSAGARAAVRDQARQDLADEMGANQGFTAWPQDVSARDVRDRLLGNR